MDTPVLRKEYPKPSSEAWNIDNVIKILDELTQMAGYRKGCLIMYSFRRGFGNSIDSEYRA